MKAFLTAAVVVAIAAGCTWLALRSFDRSTAERYADGAVILLDHPVSWLNDDGH